MGVKNRRKGRKESIGGENRRKGWEESISSINRDGSMINRLVLQSCEWTEKK
jgi:hypothetical protein